ncbi:MAG TPA: NAD(P)H-dependent oxidoreductase [Verrucomicrobiae bacterium]|nr:NAD(P)H-dependent oxidoreductase [Verrucomicrobiae bacterium]
MEPVKCLGIGCSPRKDGNTSILLERAVDGAKASGAECEILFLRDYQFSPCIACDGCHKLGKCVVKDDMQIIYAKLLAADRLILAAPIFAMGINAQAKALIDRGQRFWATKYILNQPVAPRPEGPDRKGIYLSAAGTDLPGVFDCAIRSVRYFYKMLDIKYLDSYCYPKIDAKGQIHELPSALEEVYKAGLALGN